MLTEIEKFLFNEQNLAHNVMEVCKQGKDLVVTIVACDSSEAKTAVFAQATIEYEELLLLEGESLEFPLPIIGFDCYPTTDSNYWKFVLNAADIEYGFISLWPFWL